MAMFNAPPTTPGPMSSSAGRDGGVPLPIFGLNICSGIVMAACLAVPIAAGSNLWPIAAVFWGMLTVPPAAAVGALAGWLLKRQHRKTAKIVLGAIGLVMAVGVGLMMYNS